MRKKAHEEFDPIWKRGKINRGQAYQWLAEQLGIEVGACHISWFDAATCELVIRICRKARRKNNVSNNRKRSRH